MTQFPCFENTPLISHLVHGSLNTFCEYWATPFGTHADSSREVPHIAEGSQVPSLVGNAISHAIVIPIFNRNARTQSERNAEEIVINVRNAVADLINADPVVK